MMTPRARLAYAGVLALLGLAAVAWLVAAGALGVGLAVAVVATGAATGLALGLWCARRERRAGWDEFERAFRKYAELQEARRRHR